MADIRLDTSFPAHPKTRRLRKLGGPGIVDHLITLWCYAGLFKQNGILSNMDDSDIAFAANYPEEKGDFVSILIDVGFIDDTTPRKLHDWRDHQGWIVKAPQRRKQAREAGLSSGAARRKVVNRPLNGQSTNRSTDSNEPLNGNELPSSPLPSSPLPTLPSPSLNTEEPPFDKIIADLNLVTNRTGRQILKVGEKVKGDIRARFKDGYKLEDFKHVHRVKVQEWTGTDREVYLTPETLYRPTKFPKYVAQQFPTEKQTLLNKHGEATLAAGKRVLEEMACKSKTDLKLLE